MSVGLSVCSFLTVYHCANECFSTSPTILSVSLIVFLIVFFFIIISFSLSLRLSIFFLNFLFIDKLVSFLISSFLSVRFFLPVSLFRLCPPIFMSLTTWLFVHLNSCLIFLFFLSTSLFFFLFPSLSLFLYLSISDNY